MNIDKFYSLIQHNHQIFPEVSQDLKDIHIKYPYFSVSQMLCILNLYLNNDSTYADELKKYSHNLNDRKYFFETLKAGKKKYNTKSSEIDTVHKPSVQTPVEENTVPENNIQNIQEVSEKTISKEINKTIAESIVQTEILQINENIKNKASDVTTNVKETEYTITENLSQDDTKTNKDTELNATSEDSNELPENSFSSILKKYSNKNAHTNSSSELNADTDKKERINKQREMIDKILSNLPKTIKITNDSKFYSAENKAKESLLETEDLVTETLAQIYASQGNIHKAIRAYEILSLKFPQKNTYFATKIQELKNQLKK